VETCTICHSPVDKRAARFIDRSTGVHMHVACLAGWMGSTARLNPAESSRKPETAVRDASAPVLAAAA
jgi:hypothetical protein